MNCILSIIIPVYNVEKYLNKCLDSIVNQTWENWECIIVDDCSSDLSGNIADYKANNDKRFRVIHNHKNMGVSASRNIAMKYANGKYVYFCDPDDWLDLRTFEKTIGEYCGSDMIVFGVNDVIGDDNGNLSIYPNTIWNIKEPVFISDPNDIFGEILCKTGTLTNKLIQTDLFEGEMFDEHMTYGEDIVLLTKILTKVKNAVLIPEPFYYYYKNRPGNVVSTRNIVRDLEYVKNTLNIYYTVKEFGQSKYGIYRMMVAVEYILKKHVNSHDLTRNDIKSISKVLRKVSLSDQINYFIKNKKSKANIKFCLAAYFPLLYFKWIIGCTDMIN